MKYLCKLGIHPLADTRGQDYRYFFSHKIAPDIEQYHSSLRAKQKNFFLNNQLSLINYHFKATRPGLEPGTWAPKAHVLPITPSGNTIDF